MRRPLAFVLMLMLVLLTQPASGADDAAGSILGEALVSGTGWERLAWLSDRIGPRLSGSENLERAVKWAAQEMKRDGLDRVWTEKVKVPHWVRGQEFGRIESPMAYPLSLLALGGSIGTPQGGITAEVVEVASFDELRELGDEAEGKIVLYNKEIFPNGGREHGYGSAVGLRHAGAREAAKQGAVAVIVRSLGTADFRLPHTGSMRYDEEGDTPKIPAAAISAEDAGLIHRLLASGERVRVHLSLGCHSLPDAESANVLADLRGREKPEEIVLIAAHLDSWDVGTGTIDDGVGVVIVMEVLRLLRSLDLRPRRTIRGVLFTNEENGLAGGKNYAEVHAGEVARHMVAIESDSGGATPLGFGLSAGEGGVEMVEAIAAHLSVIGASQVTSSGGGADISPLRSLGVPTMSLRQETTHYFDYHHTMADTLDKVDPGDLARNIAAMAVMAYALAEMPEPLPRPEPRE